MASKIPDLQVDGEASELLDRLSRTVSESHLREEQTEQEIRYGYRVGEFGFLIEKQIRSEAVDNAKIFSVPTSPDWMRGLINLRGNIVPVFTLGLSHEVQKNRHRQDTTLVLGEGSEMLGLMIDGLPRIVRNCTHKSDIPEELSSLNKYLSKAYMVDNELWIELDFHGLSRDRMKQGRTAPLRKN